MIAVIGDYIVDRYIYGEMNRISPESPIPIFEEKEHKKVAGGAGNVQANLGALGESTILYSDRHNCAIKTRFVVDNHIVFRSDDEVYTPNNNVDYKLPDTCVYVILSDYNKGYLSSSHELIQKLKKDNRIVIVDPKKNLSHYQGADYVKLNEKEFYKYTNSTKINKHAMQRVRKLFQIQNIVVTMGKDGVYVSTPDRDEHIPADQRMISDVTGAGDVFIAAMTHFIKKGHDLFEACRKANLLAGISVTKFGTYVLTDEDIMQTKVIFTNGCFDILHRGHVEYLRKSRELGARLIVGLNSDASVRRLKGDSRPINKQDDRKRVLESLDCVDEVIIFNEDTPRALIERVKPDVITKGGDYEPRDVVGNDLASVVIVPLVEGYSTTKIVGAL